MNKDLLTKAANGEQAALATLRHTMSPSLTVFVIPGGKLDVAATLAAWEYFKTYQTQPDEWGDEPTVNFAQAFPTRVKRDPLKLKPVTPGTWANLWDTENGHRAVAAIHWGIVHGHIRESALELRGRVRRHLNTPDQLLLDIIVEMERDEAQACIAMKAVFSPVEQERPVFTSKPSPSQVGRASMQDALEAAYQRGEVDIARYLKLKAAPTDDTWPHEKYIAVGRVIREFFSMSDVQMLIFDMGLDRDDFSSTRNAAARELTAWAKRRGQLSKLSGLIKDANPMRWAEFAADWV